MTIELDEVTAARFTLLAARNRQSPEQAIALCAFLGEMVFREIDTGAEPKIIFRRGLYITEYTLKDSALHDAAAAGEPGEEE